MTIFDIMGPIMVGPSSSHTAGAVRIGLVTRNLLGSQPIGAELTLHGSFAATGSGHGTDRALIAGLLGMEPDDPRIPQSYTFADQQGLTFQFSNGVLKDAHPNSVQIRAMDRNMKRITVVAASLGGGRIRVTSVDGLPAAFSAEKNTLIIRSQDRVGQVAAISNILSRSNVNIASMQLYRGAKGGNEILVLESDEPVPANVCQEIRSCDCITNVTYLEVGGAE
ncbi:L-serine ammonia-lyase, iron-sulfur-dependent, subunit beta [Pseudoflavonifractor sp. 524-17]|uniref:L-serine ammonia-lyase, iron-sulfur-dependent subunit beta n=1 Tax=Pseudoflavonifractor sp. 524-17 TaxID=2304577 RepID=UPI00137A7D6E|nr:L-serine ammonia-lyase, iron-sulfur-dependent subunit beta [Pseudoflavonifractor sp. 524-17]NCE65145.1 L-serine ammonia-lyase, iron-sulfur-dependent, subunit beta [Pseudoflavonifractor sp. 524-17]